MAKVTIKGLDSLIGDISSLTSDIEAGVEQARRDIAEDLADDIEIDTPVDTGTLKSTLGVSDTTVVIGGTRAPYAEDVENREPFIEPNIRAMEQKAPRIASDAILAEIE